MVGVSSGAEGERSMAGVEGVQQDMCDPIKQARKHYRTVSHDAWQGAVAARKRT
jgi:hypothetical protein